MSAQGEFASVARAGGRAALVTAVRGPHAGRKLLVRADGTAAGSLGTPELDAAACAAAAAPLWEGRSLLCEHDEHGLFVDVVTPPPRLLIFGAIDFTAALARLARMLGWHPYVIDPRARFATRERFPDAEDVIVAWPQEAVQRLGGLDRATAVAVVTHDPKLDDAALHVALRSEAMYVGAMGSRRAQARRAQRLRADGLPQELLARLAAPIGLDLGAHGAEETALSIMAEIVAARHGREGGRLAESSGPIHAAW